MLFSKPSHFLPLLAATVSHSLKVPENMTVVDFIQQISSDLPPVYRFRNATTTNSLRGAVQVYNDYGCWCRNRESYNLAHGNPRDELDKACKSYVQGLVCLQMDFPTCDLLTVSWSRFITVRQSSSGLELTCQKTDDTEDCGYSLCEIEMQALDDQSLAQEVSYDIAFTTANGFDVETCKNGEGKGKMEYDECCGGLPKRVPFFSDGGARRCCESAGKTYDATFMQCCEDGTLSVSCEQ